MLIHSGRNSRKQRLIWSSNRAALERDRANREAAIRTGTTSVPMNRRAVMCGGGAVAFEALLGSLLGGTTPVRAEGLNGTVPIVDRLAVRVVIDSYQIAVAPGT